MQRAPLLIAIFLMLLPEFYLASYVALVVPADPECGHYRIGYPWCAQVYWPLERLDRKARPAQWREFRYMVE